MYHTKIPYFDPRLGRIISGKRKCTIVIVGRVIKSLLLIVSNPTSRFTINLLIGRVVFALKLITCVSLSCETRVRVRFATPYFQNQCIGSPNLWGTKTCYRILIYPFFLFRLHKNGSRHCDLFFAKRFDVTASHKNNGGSSDSPSAR